MRIPSLFRTHRRFAALATAYADGELAGSSRASFEAHLSGCNTCAEQVEAVRQIKVAVSSLPTVQAGRSFALTPAMVGNTGPQSFRGLSGARIPLYLAATRLAAGLAVVAFVSVFAVSLLNGSSGQDKTADERLSSGASQPMADTSAPGAEAANDSVDKSAAATPVQSLAPASGGGVEGAAYASPAASVVAPPVRNSAGESATPGAGLSLADNPAGQPGVVGDALEPDTFSTRASTNDDGFPWVIVLGSAAGALVGLLYVLETNRRRRS